MDSLVGIQFQLFGQFYFMKAISKFYYFRCIRDTYLNFRKTLYLPTIKIGNHHFSLVYLYYGKKLITIDMRGSPDL
jgi:hypothetical protein